MFSRCFRLPFMFSVCLCAKTPREKPSPNTAGSKIKEVQYIARLLLVYLVYLFVQDFTLASLASSVSVVYEARHDCMSRVTLVLLSYSSN